MKLDAGALEQSGKAFIDASLQTSSAWGAALDFIDYRSSLNTSTRTANAVPVPPGSASVFNVGSPLGGKPLPVFSDFPVAVASNDGAQYETIGQSLNQEFSSAEVILTGGAVNIDNKHIRHAAFVNVEIHYTGAPLILEDVVFINCTFLMDNTQLGRQLAQIVLSNPTVNFGKAA